jgi:Na+-transporting NADH:ubiquinone oxidoreductase subunit NqrB
MTAVLVLVTTLSHAVALLVIATGAVIAREAVLEVLR